MIVTGAQEFSRAQCCHDLIGTFVGPLWTTDKPISAALRIKIYKNTATYQLRWALIDFYCLFTVIAIGLDLEGGIDC